MISSIPPLAIKLLDVLAAGNVTASAIAKACGVTDQAVSGWKKTGRIAKQHLPVLAELSGRPLEWWLSGLDRPKPAKAQYDDETILFANEFSKMDPKSRSKFRAMVLITRDAPADDYLLERIPALKRSSKQP